MVDLEFIRDKIESKKQDFINYDFAYVENSALTTFFDLSQEFENIEDFYALCVWIPNIFFDLLSGGPANFFSCLPGSPGALHHSKAQDFYDPANFRFSLS